MDNVSARPFRTGLARHQLYWRNSMKKRLIKIAITAALLSTTSAGTFAADEATTSGDQNRLLGASIGAVTGALLAGPVGFITGGVIGSFARTDSTDVSSETKASAFSDQSEASVKAPATDPSPAQNTTEQAIVLAQRGELATVLGSDRAEVSNDIETGLLTQINFDIFFLSGSTSLEDFYKPQIQAIAGLLDQLPEIDIHLEGYSDRRGDEDTNLALANQRLETVRDELEQAGIDAERIHLTAYGEQRFVSKAGHLEAYGFDRRVVIRFGDTADHTENPVARIDATAEL
jgi:outer membrane protein OmpA-like peptidoglycan-associated protein